LVSCATCIRDPGRIGQGFVLGEKTTRLPGERLTFNGANCRFIDGFDDCSIINGVIVIVAVVVVVIDVIHGNNNIFSHEFSIDIQIDIHVVVGGNSLNNNIRNM
jgi:hypothetical protein